MKTLKLMLTCITVLILSGCTSNDPAPLEAPTHAVTDGPQSDGISQYGTLPAYALPGERTRTGKADFFDDYRLANPQNYAITEATDISTASYRHMVEWEPMQSLYITYSNNMIQDPAGNTLAGIAAETVLKANTQVYVVHADDDAKNSIIERMIDNYGINQAQINEKITFFQSSNDSIWFIDYGPIPLVRDDGAIAFADFRYYHNRVLDDGLSTILGNDLGINTFRMDIKTEGGTFQGDGEGTCYTGVRGLQNAGMTAAEFNAVWEDYLNCDQLIVMKDITDDGTGHIDMFFKLVDKNLAVIGQYKAPYVIDIENENRMTENEELVEATPLMDGSSVEVVRMPFPSKANGEPRTYLNSTLVNGANLWPIYSNSLDSQAEALQVWNEVLPGWDHVGINSDQIATYSGAVHCVSRTVPEGNLVKWIDDGVCEEDGTCTGPEFGYTGTCTEKVPCSGPEWICECEDCTNCDGANFGSELTPGSCEGFCGEEAIGCYCDSECQEFGDCCDDYEEVCLEATEGEEGGSNGGCPEGLTYEGCCEGNTLTWCEDGQVEVVDCELGCGIWSNQNEYYTCFGNGNTQPIPDPAGTFPVNCSDTGSEEATEEGAEEGAEEATEEGAEEATEEGAEEATEEGTEEATEGGEAPDSCVGNCGDQAPDGCWCDDQCQGFGDCCDDYTAVCIGEGEEGGEGGEGGGAPDSCVGNCDQQAPAGCYCDDLCQGYGDCCDDYESVCLGTGTSEGGAEGGAGGAEGGTEGCPAGLTYAGCCDGNTLTWCENDTIQTGDCETGCGVWDSEGAYYTCFPPGATEQIPDPSGVFPVNCSEATETGEDEGGEATETGGDEGGEATETGGDEDGEGSRNGEGGDDTNSEESGEGTNVEEGEEGASAEEGGDDTNSEESGEGTSAEEGGEGTSAEEGGSRSTREEGEEDAVKDNENAGPDLESSGSGIDSNVDTENELSLNSPEAEVTPTLSGTVAESGCATSAEVGTPALLLLTCLLLLAYRRREEA